MPLPQCQQSGEAVPEEGVVNPHNGEEIVVVVEQIVVDIKIEIPTKIKIKTPQQPTVAVAVVVAEVLRLASRVPGTLTHLQTRFANPTGNLAVQRLSAGSPWSAPGRMLLHQNEVLASLNL